MTVALPQPYEDELLYSVIARYMQATIVDTPSKVTRLLFGRSVTPKVELIFGLDTLARQTHDTWNLSAYEIAQYHTFLPYFIAFAPEQRKEAALVSVASSRRTSLSAASLGITGYTRVDRPTKFRFCPQCATEDIARVGEPYWRRAHQLPGVFICLKHKSLLRTPPADLMRESGTRWYAARDVITDCIAHDCNDKFSWMNNSDVLTAMIRSVDLLTILPQPLKPSTHEYYLSHADAAGFVSPNGYLKVQALRTGMTAMYEEEYLKKVGLALPSLSSIWPTRMMLSEKYTQPLQHILLDHFLKQRRVSGHIVRLTNSARYLCPNPYGSHGPAHNIDKVSVHEQTDGSRIGRASCKCGLKFWFEGCRPSTEIPEISRILVFGNDWYRAARKFRADGMSNDAIANEMGISRKQVARILKRKTGSHKYIPSKREILEWRKQFNELLRKVGSAGHQGARIRNTQLFNRLALHDCEWFKASATRSALKRDANLAKPRRDWSARDHLWSVELRRAAARLKTFKGRPVRATVRAICAEARLPEVNRLDVRNKLPQCKTALADLTESMEQFQTRCLEVAAQELTSSGETLNAFNLRRLANIQPRYLLPQAADAIVRLERSLRAEPDPRPTTDK
ncbi:TniQ protein [Paraburkholderia steynii]|uniref:TniQ protein n=1 Tax=Paraburkholderia steynii TaxID=1245441 RepID=A0A7Z7BBK1_9BURK|nr:TnsD family Tn7-like transposition protein [Paraburkholderia steynii]SDI39220.1 TniQ protein [Paraburkholderia steynii]